MYAITSQDPLQLEAAVADWKLQHTLCVLGDPENMVVEYLKEKYLPNLAMGEKDGYPNGMVQPAELVFIKDKPIIAWTKNPSQMNGNGALGRPSAKKMWNYIETNVKSATDKLECTDGEEFTLTSGRCTIL